MHNIGIFRYREIGLNCTIQYITLHYIAVQYSTVQYSAVQYSATYNMIVASESILNKGGHACQEGVESPVVAEVCYNYSPYHR